MVSVFIELDHPRELKFDISAVRDLEQRLGKPLGLVLSDIQNFGVGTIETALYVGLLHEDKGLSLGLTRKLFGAYVKDRKSLRVLIRHLSDAMEETGLFQNDEETDIAGDSEGNARPEPATK